MHFDVLGPLRVTGPDGRVTVPAGRAAAGLCWLILHANEAVSAESFVPVLWAADPPASAVGRARMVIRGLGSLLEPGTLETGDGFRLVVSDDAVDARRFERLVVQARRHLDDADDRAQAEANLREALSLWRGAPCPELARTRPAQARIDRLLELRHGGQEDLNALVLAAGVDYPGVADLRAQVILRPDRPRLHRQLALALYRTHRQVEALQVLRELRSALGDPDGLAADLQAAMLRHDPALATGSHPAA